MTAVRTVAIDLGASSGRVVAAGYEHGRLALEEVHRFPTPTFRDFDTGYACWDLELLEAQVVHGLRLAQGQAPIQSLGIDTWGVDYVLLDRDRGRVGPAVCYRDDRTRGVMAEVLRQMPAEEVYRRTGIQFLSINTLIQLAQTRRVHPDWLAGTQDFLMLPDYLNFRLCGVLANEYTIASTSQMLGLGTDDWDPDLLAIAGLDRSRMSTPVEPGTVLAEVDRLFGPRQRVAVVAPASHDTASAVAAIPFEDDSEVFISSGTWSLMGFESLKPHNDPVARGFNFSNEGGVERRYRVLKNLVGLFQVQRIAQETGLDHAALAEAAGRAEPWKSLIDPEDGRFLNPASMSEAIRGFCAETGQPQPADPGSLARCSFESLALTYRKVKDEIEVLRGAPVSRIRIVGGGSQNRLLNQLCADACGVAVKAGPVETSVIGNVCVQLMAMGVFSSLGGARELVRRSWPAAAFEPVEPVPEEASRRFKAFAQLRSSGGTNR